MGTRHPLENNRPRRPLLKTSQQHTLKTTLQQILHSTLSNGAPTFRIAAAAAKIDSTRADSPVCLVRWTLDSPLLYRQVRLVLHHLQRRFAMGQVLLPHCVRLSGRDIWYRRLQGFPCSLKRWSKGTRQPSCPGFRCECPILGYGACLALLASIPSRHASLRHLLRLPRRNLYPHKPDPHSPASAECCPRSRSIPLRQGHHKAQRNRRHHWQVRQGVL